MNNKYDVIVIGAGPAGLIAAGTAAQAGKSVAVFERNNVAGVKLRATGNGRCNLTNFVSIDRFKEFYVDNPRFLTNAFNLFFNKELIALFKALGLKTKTEAGGRVFPVTDNANDVVEALLTYLKRTRAELFCRHLVADILIDKDENKVLGIRLENKQEIYAGKVIVSTGGKSYPQLGSNGSAYVWARKSGHDIINPRAGLSGICLKEEWIKGLQGISIADADISLYAAGKKKKQQKKDLVFAHYGICGPAAFDLSADVQDYLEQGNEVVLAIDLLSEMDHQQACEYLDKIISRNPKVLCRNLTLDNIPKKIIDVCLDIADTNKNKSLNCLSIKEKRGLINTLKQVKLTVQRLCALKQAMVTRGGVSIKQIDPKTMGSKLVGGLYFCGECLDVSGLTGGFNLQAAFSTGYAAGLSAGGE